MTLVDRRTAMLVAICIASFLEPLATTVVVVALPEIQRAICNGSSTLTS